MLIQLLLGLASGTDHPQAALLEFLQGPRQVGDRYQRDDFGRAAGHFTYRGGQGRRLVLGHDHRQGTGRIGGAQAGAEVVRVGNAIEHQNQRCALGAIEQLFEHCLAPDLARADFSHHALVHALNPGIHLATLGLADRHAVLRGKLEQRLQARFAAPFGQPDLLDPLGVMTQQGFHGMYAVDLFQLTHDLALGLRDAEPAFGGPLRCLLGFSDLPDLAAGLLPACLASVIKAFFISRLLRTSAFFAAAWEGK
ncbi:hypothetical protein D3C80_1308610 [compost metagenome]